MALIHKSIFRLTAAVRFPLSDARLLNLLNIPLLQCALCVSPPSSKPTTRLFFTSTTVMAPPPKKSGGAFKAGMTVQKKKMEVETDPHKLVNYLCGGQYMKEGPEIKLKADDEYPEWICTLRTNGVPELHELDPDSLEYWEKIRSLKRVTNNQLMKAVKGRRWLIKKERPNYKKLE